MAGDIFPPTQQAQVGRKGKRGSRKSPDHNHPLRINLTENLPDPLPGGLVCPSVFPMYPFSRH